MMRARNTIAALAWKEYRELHWFLVTSLVFLLFFPLLEGFSTWRQDGRFYTDMPEGMVLGFGGLLAIVFAVGATCRDLQPGLQIFWQSRPVTLRRWLTIKYVVGLIGLLIVCCGPLLFQLVLFARYMRHELGLLSPASIWLHEFLSNLFTLSVLTCHTFTIILFYSIAFLIGCLVRRAAHAAILSIAAGVLVYFLPILIPPLDWLSVYTVMRGVADRREAYEQPSYSVFVAAMVAGSVAALLASHIVVRRNWRLRLDMRLMCWTLGGIVILLFAATGFQLRSNLDCERVLPLPPGGLISDGNVIDVMGSGERGIFIAIQGHPWMKSKYAMSEPFGICRFDLSDGSVSQGTIVKGTPAWPELPHVAWLPNNPDRAYFLRDMVETGENGLRIRRDSLELCTVVLDVHRADPVIHRLDLMPKGNDPDIGLPARLHVHRDKLYLSRWSQGVGRQKHGEPAYQREMVIIDVTNGDAPVVSAVVDSKGATGFLSIQNPWGSSGTDLTEFHFQPLPGLSDQESLEIWLAMESIANSRVTLEGDVLAFVNAQELITYRLADNKNGIAHFSQIGGRQRTPLELLGGRTQPWRIILKSGLLYATEIGLRNGLAVYDLRDPTHPRRIAHYAASGGQFFALASLSEDRILLGGKGVHIVKAPRKPDG